MKSAPAIATAFFLAAIGVSGAAAQTKLPSDVSPTCVIGDAEWQNWFNTAPAKGGAVQPADSTVFPAQNTDCDFYKWGAQMFLWLMSPTQEGGITLDSNIFYDVVFGANGGNFEQNSVSAPNAMRIRKSKGVDAQSTGQAGGNFVLISQNGSITYYGVHANNVYAEYLTGWKANAFEGTGIQNDFPTTKADLGLIEKAAGHPIAEGKALAMELKTSWVDAATVGDPSRYITIEANVPTFDTRNPGHWKAAGSAVRTLALVGIHVVGSVQGHPEMIWASFEHISTAPNAGYRYTDKEGRVAEAPYDSAGDWLYIPSRAPQPAAIPPNAKSASNGDIVALKGQTIGPVPVAQLNPWGNAPDSADAKTLASNTYLVSLNASVTDRLGQLDDVRANYIQLGGIWTVKGQVPTGGTDPNNRGGLRLANSTMETFHQYPDENDGFQSQNCFFCHSTNSGKSIDISHMFTSMNPLR